MASIAPQADGISFKEFLERVPPGTNSAVNDLGGAVSYRAGAATLVALVFPEITLHCDTPTSCGGDRVFKTTHSADASEKTQKLSFVQYVCKNCSKKVKTFALSLSIGKDLKAGEAFKFGERPAFGPPTPARVISLIGPQKDLFLKGRRSENQGMGIAAFAYYRRVIEDQKGRIFDEIIRVCNRLSAGQAIVDELNRAKKETQFGTAVDAVKIGIPQALFINGHNPLTLLHSALSEGLHAQTDEECLEIATSIRVIMAEFAERMGQALKDEAELSAAVSKLLAKKSESGRQKVAADIEAREGK
jgi:hypothetical protein